MLLAEEVPLAGQVLGVQLPGRFELAVLVQQQGEQERGLQGSRIRVAEHRPATGVHLLADVDAGPRRPEEREGVYLDDAGLEGVGIIGAEAFAPMAVQVVGQVE